jgi:putative ABC transport system substrate-binding protein
VLGGLTIGRPVVARAEQSERTRRLGVFKGNAYDIPEEQAEYDVFLQRLRELGWLESRNISIEYRSLVGGPDDARSFARELIGFGPDVILCRGGPALVAMLRETRTIPIVFTYITDPVASGFVANLARPGGNATGFSNQDAEIAGKWLQLLKEIASRVTRVMVTMQADAPTQLRMRDAAASAAQSLGVKLTTAAIRDLPEVERAIEAFASEPEGGLVVLPNAITVGNRERIIALAAHYRLPAVYAYPPFARKGGLISYGTDAIPQFREAAIYVDRILRGEKPGDLPVQNPTKFELLVNLKTASELGLVVPQSILARADEVIE